MRKSKELTFSSKYAILVVDENYSPQGLKMEGTMLIPETGGNGNSPLVKDNRKEVCEVLTALDCNTHLDSGWGLLTIVPGYFYQTALGRAEYGVVYVMSRTVK